MSTKLSSRSDTVSPVDANMIVASHAADFVQAGLSIFPLLLDGTKRPKIADWQQPATVEAVKKQFSEPCGAGLVCGVHSGGLEVLDFDEDAERIYPAWAKEVDAVLCRLPVVETPSYGYHVYYRCSEVSGNKKLARSEAGRTFIETRGHGGYVVTVISPPEVHAKNNPYVQVAGPVLPEVPVITPDERMELWKAARQFDQQKKPPISIPRRSTNKGGIEAARKYVAKMEPAIAGNNGHGQTFKVACRLVGKLGLNEYDAATVLREYNNRCQPLWSEKELNHKLHEAMKVCNGS